MSLTYGPTLLTPGVAVQFQVPKNSVSVHIINFSRYFLGVYFGTTPPIGSTTTFLAPGFHAQIDPGAKPTLDIVGNYTQDRALTPAGLIEFDGNVWIQPVSIDATLALPGQSSLNYCALTSYLSGEPVPESTSASRIVDSSSQQRVIALVPGVQPAIASGTLTVAGTTIQQIGLSISNNNKTNGTAPSYLLGGGYSIPAGNTQCEFVQEVYLADVGGGLLNGPFDLGHYFVQPGASSIYLPAVAGSAVPGITVPCGAAFPTGTQVRYQLRCLSIRFAPCVVYYWILAANDQVNKQLIPTPGSFFLVNVPITPTNPGIY